MGFLRSSSLHPEDRFVHAERLCNTLIGMTLNVFSNGDMDQRKEYKTILETHANMLNDPVAVEKGQRDGLKAPENRRKLVEFKNMFSRLCEALFGPDY